MRTAGKVWGSTQLIESIPNLFEWHRIDVDAGHRCSRHSHASKYNGFFVEKGKLQITVWQPSGTVDETVLHPGDYMVVPPRVEHQFYALDNTIAFEVYWARLDPEDIDRANTGE